MCRNIKTLFNFEPPASEDEIHASALQFVRKLSGFNKPSQANAEAFDRAVALEEKAAVGEGVGRDVEYPHDGRPAREVEAASVRELEPRRLSPGPLEGFLRAGSQSRGESLQASRAPRPREDERRRARSLKPYDVDGELRG